MSDDAVRDLLLKHPEGLTLNMVCDGLSIGDRELVRDMISQAVVSSDDIESFTWIDEVQDAWRIRERESRSKPKSKPTSKKPPLLLVEIEEAKEELSEGDKVARTKEYKTLLNYLKYRKVEIPKGHLPRAERMEQMMKLKEGYLAKEGDLNSNGRAYTVKNCSECGFRGRVSNRRLNCPECGGKLILKGKENRESKLVESETPGKTEKKKPFEDIDFRVKSDSAVDDYSKGLSVERLRTVLAQRGAEVDELKMSVMDCMQREREREDITDRLRHSNAKLQDEVDFLKRKLREVTRKPFLVDSESGAMENIPQRIKLDIDVRFHVDRLFKG